MRVSAEMSDHDDLIRTLLTLAASIMEDASAAAILSPGDAATRDRVEALAQTVDDLAALARVMQLVERGGG